MRGWSQCESAKDPNTDNCVKVSYDAYDRKVTATLPEGYMLVDGVTYIRSGFEVKPSQAAYGQYAKADKKYCEPTKADGSDESCEGCAETKGEGAANGSGGNGGTGVRPGVSTDDPALDKDSSQWISAGMSGFCTNVDGVDAVNVSCCVAKKASAPAGPVSPRDVVSRQVRGRSYNAGRHLSRVYGWIVVRMRSAMVHIAFLSCLIGGGAVSCWIFSCC